ncbi:MAG: RdgB/HAM1 family non-canonical purine NTP pyrophosphatase [Candidatus Kapaibacterium sp.]|nr:MAG: RdgB/HAM1 family non-canonical purine NTP pyrophosphatase [Candidatus Kapabacteria bacterium]
MQTLLVGSNNAHKVQEMKEILETQGLARILVPNDVANFPSDIAETGSTLEENAYIKAMAIYENTLHTCLADDTGLEVDALQGAPGVLTARYAGEHASYTENRAKMLAALKDVPEAQRTARFRTVICYRDELRTLFAEGVCEGMIAQEERGSAGFGYDSIFIPQGYSQTFAELSTEEKHRISHRGLALRHFEEILRGLE